jgi:hypothetical protein
LQVSGPFLAYPSAHKSGFRKYMRDAWFVIGVDP